MENVMDLQQAAEQFIATEEGCKLRAYLCPASRLTAGYGHTGRDVLPGALYTDKQAKDWLTADTAHAIAVLDHGVDVLLTKNQAVALADFVFNEGAGAFMSSTLLRKLNAGDYQGAASEFILWDKAHVDGILVEVNGLKSRRERERDLFLSEA